MSMGLVGAHGTGKTTLAKKFAEVAKWGYFESPVSACFKELDLPFVGLTFDQRMQVQRLILKRMEEKLWELSGKPFISDRTPIDLIAYTFAEWAQGATEEQGEQLMKYREDCIKLANRHYASFILIQPGIKYEATENRPAPNAAFQTIINAMCYATMVEGQIKTFASVLNVQTTDLNDRMSFLLKVYQAGLSISMQEKKDSMVN